MDALTLKPIINSKIEVHFDKYDNGQTSQAKLYITDSSGEIVVPIEGKAYSFRSDKSDNAGYVKGTDLVIIDALQTPTYTIYLNPIFDLNVKLKTDFNFLTSFFRRFRYGSYLETPSSELNTGSVIEPNCFVAKILKKGKTINQYSDALKIRTYFSRDLNSSTREPYRCSIYVWEGIRKVAGIKEIVFFFSDSRSNK